MKLSRGIRNKNPLNIVKNPSIHWLGEIRPSTDANFCQFETLEYGLRAALKLLRTYYRKYQRKTLRQIIHRWCPDHTAESYVANVCRMTGLEADQQLPPMKEETKVVWCDIVLAMAAVECGLDTQQREELAVYVDRSFALN